MTDDTMTQLGIQFTVGGRIARPVHDVFEAVADPDQLSHYFTTAGAKGRLETGSTVVWDFEDFPGAFPVEVAEVVQDEKIVLRWGPPDGVTTTVEMTFAPIDDGRRTYVRISEFGWEADQDGLDRSYSNCEGWTGMLSALKVWLEHGINLREGFYV